jgi:UDPglucose--hexose-1-phosphate uridylyltransferase
VSELRRNPLSGQWVVVAPERAARPDDFVAAPHAGGVDPADCPFCPGNETMTPPEVARTGDGESETPGWRVRVVPNLYPIVEGPPAPMAARGVRFHDATRATGAHEVVVISPDHDRTLADLTGVELEELFGAVAARVAHHLDAGHGYVQVLVNHGREAGASIEHPHLQLVAVDVPPPVVADEATRIAAGRECPVCRGVQEDADTGSPFVVTDGSAPAWCPWWSGVPFELLLAPRRHQPRFDQAGGDLGEVARSLGRALGLLRHRLGDVPYNAVVHTAPTPSAHFHWHVHVWPRLSVLAGFEQGTGILVNQVPPEQAAEGLRGAGTRS